MQLQTLVIILAAGEASRFDGPGYKQLLEVEGTPILHRTVDLLARRKFLHQYLITHIPSLHVEEIETFSPLSNNRWTCETLLATEPLWSEYRRVVVFMSDCYYTERAIDMALHVEKEFCVYSDGQDIFTISFSNTAFSTLRSILQSIVRNESNEQGNNSGRLWEAYRQWHRLPNHSPLPIEMTRGTTYEPVDDVTQDFDTMEDYYSFLRGESKNALLRMRSSRA